MPYIHTTVLASSSALSGMRRWISQIMILFQKMYQCEHCWVMLILCRFRWEKAPQSSPHHMEMQSISDVQFIKWQPGCCNGPTAPWSIADFKSSPLSAKLVPMKAGCPRGTSALSLLNQGARPGAISSTHPQETLTEGVMLTMAKSKVFKHKLCC